MKSAIMTLIFMLGCLTACSPDKKSAAPRLTWQLQHSNITASFRGLCVVNEKIAWAGGSSSTYTRTIDGGRTWQTDTIPGATSLDFRDIQAFDANTAMVISAGRPAKIFKTIDGGTNWLEKYSNDREGIFFNSMAFWDAENGIAVGDPINGYFIIIITSDGGESWHQVGMENMPPARQGEANFAASGTCIAVQGKNRAWFATGGAVARVFRSTDRGRTWQVADTPMICGSPSTGIFSIAFYDDKNGIVVGGDYRNPNDNASNAAVTGDGGITWTLTDDNARPNGYRSCVAFLPGTAGTTLLTVGTTGSDISVDSGWSWTKVDTIGYHTIGFAASKAVGWAVGSEGRIAKLMIKME